MGKIRLEGLHKVEKINGKATKEEYKLMEEFCTYLCVWKHRLYVGIWDKSMVAEKYDKRGAFFDGIGGHLVLDEIDAYLLVEGLDNIYEESPEEENTFIEKFYGLEED